MPFFGKSLGEILTLQGAISSDALSRSLSAQALSNSRLGDILVAEGSINYLQLYHALAQHHGLVFVNLLHNPPDAHLLTIEDTETYLQKGFLPWREHDDKIIVAVAEYSESLRAYLSARYTKTIDYVITSPFDIRKTIEHTLGFSLEERSRFALWEQNPISSARQTLLPSTKPLLQISIGLLCLFIALFPLQSALILMAFCSISYGVSMIIKALIFAKGTKRKTPINWKKAIAELDEKTLPIYTILIPMYREVESLPSIIAAMQLMDYPAEKLDIKLIMEADDAETLAAAYALKPRHQFEIIRVPASPLRTKPKACNYALRFARGDYVTVFDADDQPDPQQLKKAIITFRNSPPDVVCLQAHLNYYNAQDNWLTRFFAFEYAILFEVLLYGLQRLKIPLPLGGTSNHISLEHLRSLGEWDPFNVTEDADLGTRLAARGLRTHMLDSYTLEEAPIKIPAWIRQRSRWMKGYMQTWLVHMRKPQQLYYTLGARSFWGFQFFMGFSTFTFLTGPLVWFISLAWYFFPPALPENALPMWLMLLTVLNIALNLITHWYMSFYCLKHFIAPLPRNRIAALFYSTYLFLHAIASYRALWQLIVNPHFWEKTMHGFAKQSTTREKTLISQEI